MTNLDSILKSRDITLPTKVHLVKAMVFPVVMYGCESWTIKKPEHPIIDAFDQWCWRRLLRVPWTARRSNQSILKEISSGCSLEGLMLRLKLQYFGQLMRRADSWKDPDAGKDWGQEEKGMTEDEMVGWHHRLDGHGFGWTPGVADGQGGLACCGSWGRKESDMTERLNWTEPQGTRLRGIWTQASFSTKVMKPAHPGLPEQPPRRFRCWHQTQWSRSCCCLSLSSRVGRTGESWNWQLSPSAPAEVEVVFFIHPLHNLLLYVNSGAVL